ncbi:hypothetical protein EST38_g11152 [Candolleomyces aberdarensis]|uniref:RNase H type-1 domain-containing protein n=1 Tax=Candolleomyces aberdarensis TaxID=2316362 RepID=A0A4Q2D5K9_9AGAR|nr:hypothetical protein EST38_g11152 [Candolleomyces aberdarensis]
MKIFRIRSVGLACTLISYVDDGDIVQSPEIATNCVMLRHAYGAPHQPAESRVWQAFPPISLHIQKLSQRAIYRTATLSDTHPIRSLMKGEHAKAATPNLGASCWMSVARQKNVCDAITETCAKLDRLTEVFSPCAEENSPGLRLMDRHHDRVSFNDFDPKAEDALVKRRHLLDSTYRQAIASHAAVCFGTDCSVPKRTAHQATASFVMNGAGREPVTSTWVTGRVLSACAELFAIRSAIIRATMLEGCSRIIIFTDSMAAARRSVDPSVHSGQAHSLAVCKALGEWFSNGEDRSLEFIGAPSKLKWGIHHQAHVASRSLPPIPGTGVLKSEY